MCCLEVPQFLSRIDSVLNYESECDCENQGEVSITCACGNYSSHVNMNLENPNLLK